MKKYLLVLSVSLVMLLAACGGENENSSDTTNDTNAADVNDNEEIDNGNDENNTDDDIYFDGTTAQIEDVKVEITDTKVIPVGEEGNEHGDDPVFAVWYEATNFTDDDIDPGMAWMAIFDAIQDNDDDRENTLEVGALPDEDHLDTQTDNIKKDGTVENSIAYELDDEETPVTLVASQGVGGEEIGREDFEIK